MKIKRKRNFKCWYWKFDEYADVGTHWISLFCNKYKIVYFDSFRVEHIPEEIKEFIDRPSSSASQNKNITANIFEE